MRGSKPPEVVLSDHGCGTRGGGATGDRRSVWLHYPRSLCGAGSSETAEESFARR
jgi:hypothetical protein